jgi:uncharacterized protein (TIGR02246 family)
MATITDVVQGLCAAWNQHDPDKIASYFTEDCIYENELAGVVGRGRDVVRNFATEGFKVNPDFKLELKNVFASGNMSASEGVMSGTHVGQDRRYCSIAEHQGDLLKRITLYVTK